MKPDPAAQSLTTELLSDCYSLLGRLEDKLSDLTFNDPGLAGSCDDLRGDIGDMQKRIRRIKE